MAAISLGAVSRLPTLAAIAAGVGLVLYLWSMRADRSIEDRHVFRWAGLAVFLIVLARFSQPVGPFPESERTARPLWLALLFVASVLAVGWGHKRMPRLVSLMAGLLAVLTITSAMTTGEWRSEFGVDVYQMHRAAGRALLVGENPYTDAVQVANGSPHAPPDSIVEGYPYPPVVLGTYAVPAAVADPRLASTVSWLGLLVWLGWHASRSGSRADTAYGMFILLAGLAVWPVVWYSSWTEPISVGLFLLTAIWWRSRPVLSAVALGLAVASKQYFLLLLPLLVIHRDESKRMRLAVSAGVATATLLFGLVPDSSAFISATILNLTEVGFRPDTQSLSGLLATYGFELYLPGWLWVAAGLAVGVAVSRGSHTRADFVGRAGLSMGIAFFIGQSFPNYWFLVLSLLAMAATVDVHAQESGPRWRRKRSAPAVSS